MPTPCALAGAHVSQRPSLAEGRQPLWDSKDVEPSREGVCHARAAAGSSHVCQPPHAARPRIMGGCARATWVCNAWLALRHDRRVGVASRRQARALGRSLCSGRVMDPGVCPSGCLQITPGRLPLLISGVESLLTRCRRQGLVVPVDRLEWTAITGEAVCPHAIPRLAQEAQRTDQRVPSVGVLWPDISHRLAGWSQCSPPPDALHVALGCPRQSSAGSQPLEVSVAGEREPIPGSIGRSPRESGVSPRDSKRRTSTTLHLRRHEPNRMRCRDRVIKRIRQKTRWRPAVSRNVAHPACLLCIRGR
jgi:hypothetical protein